MRKLEEELEKFKSGNAFITKGPLSVAVAMTRRVASLEPPFDEKEFLTEGGGQVANLGKGAFQRVLKDYGISRVLAEEGGRTSRGSIKKMQVYLSFLNDLHRKRVLALDKIEAWWIEQVQRYFASLPIELRLDQSKSLTRIIGELIDAAFIRQKECPGTMVVGAVMQHLVGAKLQVALPNATISHHGFSVADAPGGRKGDFVIEDTVIHVTTAPSDALIRKCSENLSSNLRPMIITVDTGVGGALAHARAANLAERIDILEIGQFIVTNVSEWSGFSQRERPASIARIIDAYNTIVENCETDPSLKIAID